MKYYITQKGGEHDHDFTIVKVKEDLIELFESVHTGQVLAVGESLQEVIGSFGDKEDFWQPIDPGTGQALTIIPQESTRRR